MSCNRLRMAFESSIKCCRNLKRGNRAMPSPLGRFQDLHGECMTHMAAKTEQLLVAYFP
jgi:hypothetical protein